MKETKHTPGPWEVNIDEEIYNEHYVRMYSIDQCEGAPIEHGKLNRQAHLADVYELEANALLIATAPELLEMLQHAVELMEELKVGSHDVQVYKRVIQKAKGL